MLYEVITILRDPVGPGEERRNGRDSGDSRASQGGHGLGRDAPDGDYGNGYRAANGFQGLLRHRLGVGLGSGGEYRPYPEIVGAGRLGEEGFPYGGHGHPQDERRGEPTRDFGDIAVFLPDVKARRERVHGESQGVVHDEGYAAPAAQLGDFPSYNFV